jgi:hypothetical protein
VVRNAEDDNPSPKTQPELSLDSPPGATPFWDAVRIPQDQSVAVFLYFTGQQHIGVTELHPGPHDFNMVAEANVNPLRVTKAVGPRCTSRFSFSVFRMICAPGPPP